MRSGLTALFLAAMVVTAGAVQHDGDLAAAPAGDAAATPAPQQPAADSTALPVIEYDPAKLPPPVRRLREQILEVTRSGDLDRLQPILDGNPGPPTFSFGGLEGTPLEQLRALSGDGEGREILAILEEVLEAGYVHVDVGTDEEMYVWPYFARYPLEDLTGPQMVELFRLVTAGDYQDMLSFGAYNFYRVGIRPDGSWDYFVAGD